MKLNAVILILFASNLIVLGVAAYYILRIISGYYGS